MTQDEERFHYFSMNDLNKDRFLDGIEVWKVCWNIFESHGLCGNGNLYFQAVHHTHSDDGELTGPPPEHVTDEEVEKSVDEIMKEIDLNGDGLIDYSEYLKKVQG